MQTAGYFISATAEFSSGMKNCKYNLYRRDSRFMINSYRNASSIIDNRNRIIFVNCNFYCITITGQCLVYRIIHNLIHKVMQTRQ